MKNLFSIPFISQWPERRKQHKETAAREQFENRCLLTTYFNRQEVGEIIKTREPKPKINNQKCVVYRFKCGVCEMDYTTPILRMMFNTSKRRLTLILIFLVKCLNKHLITRLQFSGGSRGGAPLILGEKK